MTWNYQKRIKIIPGVHVNLSKSGMTTSIGVKGANVTLGKSEVYLNQGISGTGLHFRQKISQDNFNQNEGFLPNVLEAEDTIFSADVQEITSQNMQGVKEAILSAHQQRKDLTDDLLKVKSTLGMSKLKLTVSYILLYGLIKKEIADKTKSDIQVKRKAIEEIKQQIENCYVGLDIEFDDEIKVMYDKIVYDFKNLMTSKKIWDVTSAYSQDRKTTRSAAGTLVKKQEVRFTMKSLPTIRSHHEALCFHNRNGADVYIYPTFIVMYSSKTKFAIIGFDEFGFYHSYCRFIETGVIPKDTQIIDKTWLKVNKNGSQDKRFKGNYQIPIVKYGEINLKTKTGMNEEYQFSNYEFTQAFGTSFAKYQTTINGLNLIG